jgi:small-conductance mechanosensitive channel
MPHYADTLIRVAAVLVVALILTRIAVWVAERIRSRIGDGEPPSSSTPRARRAHTLAGIVKIAAVIAIWLLAAFTLLDQLGVHIGPMLAAAGVGGIAIGLGAQSLVRDLIAGFFILAEHQFDVGDVIEVAGVSGRVEHVGLRTTTLRNLDGRRHVVPNGEIRISTNMTKEFSRYMVDLPMPYDEDPERVADIARAVADRMREDPEYADLITGPVEVLGVDAFADSAVTLKLYLETLPGRQWTVGREFRRRIKIALEEEGIGIPYPHRTVILRSENGGGGVEDALRRSA